MTEEIKDLIEKIQQEGVQAAEEKAKEIGAQARQQAQQIIQKAKQEAEKLITDAMDKIKNAQEAADTSLKQVGRNLLISLRKEIDSTLDKVVSKVVQQSFSPQEIARIISLLIKDYNGKEGVIISLKKEDAQILEKNLFNELSEEIKKGIVLKAQEDISGGFIISFDSGKSHFDFTDKAITDYLGQYLRPKLAELLKS